MNNNYTEEYYLKKAQEFYNKADPYINDAFLGAYGSVLSAGTKSEFPIIFLCSTLLSVAQVNYYLFKRNQCYKKMEKEEGMTEPIRLRRVIEYKKR